MRNIGQASLRSAIGKDCIRGRPTKTTLRSGSYADTWCSSHNTALRTSHPLQSQTSTATLTSSLSFSTQSVLNSVHFIMRGGELGVNESQIQASKPLNASPSTTTTLQHHHANNFNNASLRRKRSCIEKKSLSSTNESLSLSPNMSFEQIKDTIYYVKNAASSPRDVDKASRILIRLLDVTRTAPINASPESQNAQPNKIFTFKKWVTLAESFLMTVQRQRNLDRIKFCTIALEILKHLESSPSLTPKLDLDHTDPEIQQSILKMYNMTLDSMAKSNRSDSIARIQQLLRHMNDQSSTSPEPNSSSYNSLLNAYANSMPRSSKESAKKCEHELRKMLRNSKLKSLVDTVSYNIVINAWGKSNDTHAANRAEMLLQEMQEHHSNQSTTNVLQTTNNPLTNTEILGSAASIKPNLVSFTSVISAWSRFSGTDVEAAQRAEDIFNLLDELSVLDPELRPNAFTFHAVMNAFSKSSLPGAATKAQDLLDKMLERYKAGEDGAKPNRISFSICIMTWSKSEESGKSQRATILLKQMQELSREGYDTLPDIGIYNSILRAFANDNDEDKATKAEQILEQIEISNLKPDLITYNNVLRCCCSTKSDDRQLQRNAVRIATHTLLKIQKGGIKPDPYTFNFFIKACDRLSGGNEKLKLIKAAFLYCIESGQFSPPVLSLLKNALNPKELKNILQLPNETNLQYLSVDNFPKGWSSGYKKGGK